MFTNIKNLFIVLLLVIVISQFLRPDKNESSYDNIASFEEATMVSSEVKAILQNNCYDCHSTNTRYPWYMEVSPVSHWMAYHIEEGKEHFNVAKWDTYTKKQKDHKLEEFIEELEKKKMPLKSYTWINGELSNEDAEKLIQWAKDNRARVNAPVDTIATTTVDSIAVDTLKVKTGDSIQ